LRTDRTERPGERNKPGGTAERRNPDKNADRQARNATPDPRKIRDDVRRNDGRSTAKDAPRPPRRAGSGRDSGRDQIYGRNAVLAVLHGRRHVETLFIADSVGKDARLTEIREAAGHRHVTVQSVPRQQIENYVGKVNHQGVLALAERFAYSPLATILDRPGPIVVLDHVSDPQNLGSLFRTGAAFDIAGVVIPADRAAGITPAVVNASAGAVEVVPVAQVVNLNRALRDIREAGRWIVGLDSGEDSVSLFEADLPTPACLVLGSEGKGIAAQTRSLCDLIVRIPIGHEVESLNVAVAGSIALYELNRRAFLTSDRHSNVAKQSEKA
jgi:23S rRNA (guanosine2251-2'-O)-methyltransferase